MSFVPGKVIKEFEVDGKKVRFRYPRWEDLNQLHKYINSLIRERTLIGMQKPMKRKGELDWLSNEFKRMENKDVVRIVTEVDGKVIGSSGIYRKKLDSNKHVGVLGVSLRKEYRRMGIGKETVNTLVKLAKKEMGLKIIQSSYYDKNKASEKLHRKCGFREIGRIPKGCKYYGKYYDEVIMYREV